MNDATQTGVAMAAIAMVSTVVGLVVGYFKDRDKLRYDAELSGLRAQNAGQAKQMAEQDAKITLLESANRECEQRGEDRDRRIAALEQRLSDHLARGTASRAALPPTTHPE